MALAICSSLAYLKQGRQKKSACPPSTRSGPGSPAPPAPQRQAECCSCYTTRPSSCGHPTAGGRLWRTSRKGCTNTPCPPDTLATLNAAPPCIALCRHYLALPRVRSTYPVGLVHRLLMRQIATDIHGTQLRMHARCIRVEISGIPTLTTLNTKTTPAK